MKREVVRILSLSPLYWEMHLAERLALVLWLAQQYNLKLRRDN